MHRDPHLGRRLIRALLLALPLLILLLSAPSAFAARVEKVKGKQILIDGEGEELVEGDKYFIIIDGKKKGVVRIEKFKNGKAIGRLTKGKAEIDAGVEPAKPGGSSGGGGGGGGGEEAGGDDLSPKKKGKKEAGGYEPGMFIGGMLGYAMDSQSVKGDAGSVSMSGSGFSLKGYGDMPLSGKIGLIGRGGIEQLSLKGSVAGISFKTEIMYITADALIRYSFSQAAFEPYVAGGLGLHFPLSKTSDVLDEARISATTVFFGDLGMNYHTNGNTMYTVVLEYGFFPPSNNVSTSFIALRGGMAWRF